MLASHVRLLIATLWVGNLWTVGYLVAPTLFLTLSDKMLAGTIVSSLFRVEAWFSICSAVTLVALLMRAADEDNAGRYRTLLGLVFGMLLCTLIGYFCLQPYMAELQVTLREAAGSSSVIVSDAKMQFGILHGISSGIYLIDSLLGVALIFKLRC